MNVLPIMERIQATRLFQSVGSATALADALEDPIDMAAFVVVPSQRAEGNRTTGRHSQRITERLSIVFCVKGAAANPDQPADDVQRLRDALLDLMAGWKAEDAETALDFLSSSVRSMSAGFVWTEMLFEAQWRYTKA